MSHASPAFSPLDPGRVNSMDPVEMEYWCQELECSAETLQAGIDAVGEHVAALRDWLERRAGKS